MAILAMSLPKPNLFSNLPTTSPPTHNPNSTSLPQPPIPIPKYPKNNPNSSKPQKKPGPPFKTHHNNSKYHKPVKPGQVITDDGDRSVVVKDSGVSYRLPGAPFDFQFSYSETPKAKPVAIREPAFLPFAPPTMPRPWTGKAPMKKSKRNIKLFEPLNPQMESNDDGGKRYEMLRPYELGMFEEKPKKKVLGPPLTKEEIRELLKHCIASNRQVNIGRDGLVHNMLELIHTHWRRNPVCKVRCLGVPTVDMNNLCQCLEEKTGGKIIHRVGGVVYLFRGRNYDQRTRPKYPLMLWKPATPVYPKLIQEAPEGLTKEEADELRIKGKKLPPICKLAKNGVYLTLVREVRSAFEACPLVKIDCRGMHASDYKKLGAKLKELVPCVLLSFDDEQILMWRGKDWKPMYGNAPPVVSSRIDGGTDQINTSGRSGTAKDYSNADSRTRITSPKMMSLWKNAIDSGKALLLDDVDLKPDDLLNKVEEFESISQAIEHTFPALVLSSKRVLEQSKVSWKGSSDDDNDSDEDDHEDKYYINDSFEALESTIPKGLLPGCSKYTWRPVMRTATSSYWLTWRFLILGSGLLVLVGISALIIWKYEGSPKSGKQEKDSKKKKVGFLYKDEAWTTCHKSIHPAWLLAYRLIAFIFLLSMLSSDAFLNSTDIFFFYTQWTFSLVTIYFGLGSSLSIYGCIQYRKGAKICSIDEERNDSPTLEKNASLPGVSKELSSNEEIDAREPAGYLGYAFQIIFQVCAGAVVLTDCIYWLLIYPFFLPRGFGLQFLVVGMHSINAITLLGDVILNSLRFPFFRFAYFVLYTCTFVAFQWLVHMCVSKWWPYPFLDISYKYAPLVYLMVGVIHLPCYGMFALVIALKYWLARLFKWIMRKLSGNKQ